MSVVGPYLSWAVRSHVPQPLLHVPYVACRDRPVGVNVIPEVQDRDELPKALLHVADIRGSNAKVDVHVAPKGGHSPCVQNSIPSF